MSQRKIIKNVLTGFFIVLNFTLYGEVSSQVIDEFIVNNLSSERSPNIYIYESEIPVLVSLEEDFWGLEIAVCYLPNNIEFKYNKCDDGDLSLDMGFHNYAANLINPGSSFPSWRFEILRTPFSCEYVIRKNESTPPDATYEILHHKTLCLDIDP